MKKVYSKKQLALLILDNNPNIFIPLESLIDDLNHIYKLRKIAKKIINNTEYSVPLLKNLITTSNNIFGSNCSLLYNVIMSEEEYRAIKDWL